MRSSKSRSRNKSNRQRSLGNIINRVFDSSGPEGKVRGTPQQIIDKYLMLARDAQLSNDRVAEQAFLQHAEHYTRMLGEAQREMAREQEQRQQQNGGHGNGGERGDNGRERFDNRPRDEEDDQPDFAPLGEVSETETQDEGPGLVETPEMYHAPRAESFGGHQPDFLTAPLPEIAPVEKNRRRETGDRPPRPEGKGGEKAGERRERGPRGPRKPREDKPKPARAEDQPVEARPETSESE